MVSNMLSGRQSCIQEPVKSDRLQSGLSRASARKREDRCYVHVAMIETYLSVRDATCAVEVKCAVPVISLSP